MSKDISKDMDYSEAVDELTTRIATLTKNSGWEYSNYYNDIMFYKNMLEILKKQKNSIKKQRKEKKRWKKKALEYKKTLRMYGVFLDDEDYDDWDDGYDTPIYY